MRPNTTVILVDVETVQNNDTGERIINITGRKTLIGEKSPVGLNTFWAAAANHITLDHAVTIRTQMYGNQKYIVMGNKLYEVYNVSKADTPLNIRLNVRRVDDKGLEEAILDALGFIQTP